MNPVTFQHLYAPNGGLGQRFIFFTIKTSSLVAGQPTYACTGVDQAGGTYTCTMTRGLRVSFACTNIVKTN